MPKMCKFPSSGHPAYNSTGSLLQKILGMSWKLPVRVLIHIADAPPHGVKFHAPHLHDTNQTDADGTIMKGLLTQLKSLEINFFFGKILPETDEVFKFDRYCYYDSHLVHLHSIPFFNTGQPRPLFCLFYFFSPSGIKLGSYGPKSAALSTRPPPRPHST